MSHSHLIAILSSALVVLLLSCTVKPSDKAVQNAETINVETLRNFIVDHAVENGSPAMSLVTFAKNYTGPHEDEIKRMIYYTDPSTRKSQLWQYFPENVFKQDAIVLKAPLPLIVDGIEQTLVARSSGKAELVKE